METLRWTGFPLLHAVCSRSNLKMQWHGPLTSSRESSVQEWFCPLSREKPLLRLAVGLNSSIICSKRFENQAKGRREFLQILCDFNELLSLLISWRWDRRHHVPLNSVTSSVHLTTMCREAAVYTLLSGRQSWWP